MNETVMPLAEHMQIVVSDRHTFGTDAVVLADFARIRRRDRALDLGTGCGIIPLLWPVSYTHLTLPTTSRV